MGKLAGQRGFTLVELMVTVAIAAILLSVAVPGFRAISQKSQQTNTINDIASMFGRARSEAVARNKDVVICVSSNQATCDVGFSTWESGWIVFVDANSSSAMDLGDTLLLVHGPLPAGVTVRTSGFPVDHVAIARGTGLLSQTGTFRYCDARGVAELRALNVSLAGQSRVAVDSDHDGAVEDVTGANLNACP